MSGKRVGEAEASRVAAASKGVIEGRQALIAFLELALLAFLLPLFLKITVIHTTTTS
jgi:hypothetical protein